MALIDLYLAKSPHTMQHTIDLYRFGMKGDGHRGRRWAGPSPRRSATRRGLIIALLAARP